MTLYDLIDEARGLLRWLQSDYQIPKLGHKVVRLGGTTSKFNVTSTLKADWLKLPNDGLDKIRVVVGMQAQVPAPMQLDAITAAFDGRDTSKRMSCVEGVVNTLIATGCASTGKLDGQTRYFVPR